MSLRLCRLSVLKPPADFARAIPTRFMKRRRPKNGIFLACGFVAHFGLVFGLKLSAIVHDTARKPSP